MGPVTEPPAPSAERPRRFRRLWRRAVDPARTLTKVADDVVVPTWQHVTEGESTVPVVLATAFAGALQAMLPSEIAPQARWLFPAAAAGLTLFIVIAYRRRFRRQAGWMRVTLLTLIAAMSVVNIAEAVRLVSNLLDQGAIDEASRLLWGAGSLWATNVVVFALWYWMFDRGGPVERSHSPGLYPDFLFPQLTSPELARPGWAPNFWDYLYTSFTNSTAFSPTDTLPMSRWAKLTMLVQSVVALGLAVLVVARAVNIL